MLRLKTPTTDSFDFANYVCALGERSTFNVMTLLIWYQRFLIYSEVPVSKNIGHRIRSPVCYIA